MIRQVMVEKHIGEEGFRWRGQEVSRIEGFSDAVFAFAMTLLVVSLEVPHTFTELLGTIRGFIAFGISFYLLILVWYGHYQFFRRYGLQDAITTWLNTFLLFVILFYVYPLKFLFTLLINQALLSLGVPGFSLDVALPGGGTAPMIEPNQVATLMIIYGAGYLAVNFLFALFYYRAYTRRHDLELNALETFDTRASLRVYLMNGGVALLSILIAALGGEAFSSLAGLAYFLIMPMLTINGVINGRQRRILEEQQAGSPT